MGRSREEIAFYGVFAKTGSRDPEARSSWGKLAAATSCQIDRRPTTALVVDRMCDDLKATASKDHPIFLKCQAGVIKRLATETSKSSRRSGPAVNIKTASSAARRMHV